MSLANSVTPELIHRSKTDDLDARDELIERSIEFLRDEAALQIGSRHRGRIRVSSIVQTASLSIRQGLPQFNGKTAAELQQWMRRIVRNDVIDSVRKQQARDDLAGALGDGLQLLPDGSIVSPSEQLHEQESRQQLREAIAELDSHLQQPIELHLFEGLKAREIAQQTGGNAGHIRRNLKTAIGILTEKLSGKNDSAET